MSIYGSRKLQTLTLKVDVITADIEKGDCRNANRCMIRVAVERLLRKLDPTIGNHHSRVDAGHVYFNFQGHRHKGDLPKSAKNALIQFDKEDKARQHAHRAGEVFKSAVKPFSFTLVAVKGSKVEPMTRARQEQINEARRRRTAAGQKQKRYTLRERIVGFT